MIPTPCGFAGLSDPSARQFFAVDELLQERGVAATEFRWVAGQQPPMVELQSLPTSGPFGYV
jgi:hypothetical protein